MNTGGNAEVNEYTRVEEVGQPTPPNFQYDANGNLTFDGARTYRYDSRDQLVEVSQGVTTLAQFVYDAAGRRVRKVTGSGTTAYYYSGGRCIEERDGSDNTLKQYTLPMEPRDGNGRSTVRCYDILSAAFAGKRHYLEDAVGDTAAIVDPAGVPVDRYEYDAFGRMRNSAPTSVGNEFLYRGCRLDPGTGLYLVESGYYSPDLGRTLQRGELDGLGNGYTYAGNAGVNGPRPTRASWDPERTAGDIDILDFYVLYYASGGGNADLKYYADKVRHFNDLKDLVARVGPVLLGRTIDRGAREQGLYAISTDATPRSDKRKQSLYFPEVMLSRPAAGDETSRWNIERWHLEEFRIGPFDSKSSSNLSQSVTIDVERLTDADPAYRSHRLFVGNLSAIRRTESRKSRKIMVVR